MLDLIMSKYYHVIYSLFHIDIIHINIDGWLNGLRSEPQAPEPEDF